jgi:hypothetical protein
MTEEFNNEFSLKSITWCVDAEDGFNKGFSLRSITCCVLVDDFRNEFSLRSITSCTVVMKGFSSKSVIFVMLFLFGISVGRCGEVENHDEFFAVFPDEVPLFDVAATRVEAPFGVTTVDECFSRNDDM